MANGVDFAGDAHVEEHDGANEHAQETDEQEMPHGVGVVIGESNSGSFSVCHLVCSDGVALQIGAGKYPAEFPAKKIYG